MKKTITLILCLMLVLSASSSFAASKAQNTTTIVPIIELPAYMPVISGYVDLQAMPKGTMSRWTYVPSQPDGGLVDNLLLRQYGLALNVNLDGNVTANTAYHLNGYSYVNYYQPNIQDTFYQFQPVFQGSGYVYNIAPYLGFINYQAGRMAYAPGAGLLLYSNMDGVQLNIDAGQLQINLYGGNDTTPAMQTFVVPGAMNTAILQAQDSDPYGDWAINQNGTKVKDISRYNLGVRMVAADASYNFNNPLTIKIGYSDTFAANNGSNTYYSGTQNGINYMTRLTMADVGLFWDDGTWHAQVRAGLSPSNNLQQYKDALGDSLCNMGMDAKVKYGRYDISTPGSYDIALAYGKVGPLAGFSPDVPQIANSGESYRVYGDYVIDTNFKGNLGYSYIKGLQPTTIDQARAKGGYDTSSYVNLGLTYYF